MYLLQDFYILILNNVYKITSKIDEKVRMAIIKTCLFLIMMQCILYTSWHYWGITFGYAELSVINTLLLGVVIIFSVDRTLHRVKWNKFIAVPWFICPIIIILSSFHHKNASSFVFFAGIMLLVFPCLYFVWNNRGDYDAFYRMVCKAVILSVVVFFIYSILVFPYDGVTAYMGVSINPNSNGLIGAGGTLASFYMLLAGRKHRLLFIVPLGMSVTLAYLSLSRASILAILLMLIVFTICFIRENYKSRKLVKSMAIICLMVIITIISMGVYKEIFIKVTPNISPYITELGISRVYADDSEPNPLVGKFTKGNNLNEMSSGRIGIWKCYIEELNLLGNERLEKGLYIEDMGVNISAHNSYIEIAYRSGIFAGICYALIILYAIVQSFKILFGRKSFDVSLAIIPLSVAAFFVLSNVERALYPIEKIHIFMYFISMMPIFAKRENNTELDESEKLV